MSWTRLNQKKVTWEIVLCKTCEGRGHVFEEKLVNYHRGEYESVRPPCRYCESSGRMVRTTTVEEKPYEDKSGEKASSQEDARTS